MDFLLLASFQGVMTYIGYILIAILILMIMITVHEFGHYIVGKLFGFGITEFAIGFGPKIYKKEKKNGELFSIRAFPVGGFCAFKGEDENSDDPTAFNNKKPWQRILVLISGALMNYLLALLVIIIMFASYGQMTLMAFEVTPSNDIESQYCLQNRDIFIKANGKNVYMMTDLINAVDGYKKGDRVDFVIRRNGEDINVQLELRDDADFKNITDTEKLFSVLGVKYDTDENGKMTTSYMYSTSVRFGFFKTIGRSFQYSFILAGTVFTVLHQLLTGALGIGAMGGTVTTIAVTADAIRMGGFMYLLNITALIGVNLAVFNLLPVPALDGARVVFVLIEWIFKKPVNRNVEGIIHTVGLFLLLLFAIFVDLQHCF